jgi:hypothetical protein
MRKSQSNCIHAVHSLCVINGVYGCLDLSAFFLFQAGPFQGLVVLSVFLVSDVAPLQGRGVQPNDFVRLE